MITNTLSFTEAVDGGTPTSSLNALAIVLEVSLELEDNKLIDTGRGMMAVRCLMI